MKRIATILVTILFISVSADAATDCNMTEHPVGHSVIKYISPVSTHNSGDCCSISAEEYEKEISFQNQNDHNQVITNNFCEIDQTILFQNFLTGFPDITFVFPPPLNTIRFLC